MDNSRSAAKLGQSTESKVNAFILFQLYETNYHKLINTYLQTLVNKMANFFLYSASIKILQRNAFRYKHAV